MSKIAFIEAEGVEAVREAALPDEVSHAALLEALQAAGVTVDGVSVFFDEEDEPFDAKSKPRHVKDGVRIHITRCKKIAVTIHYLDQTAEQKFAPGARVKSVKAWAVRHFRIDKGDAAEHVLQICNSQDQPPTDTPLQKLTKASVCAVCFDLVPEKRVEG